MTVIFILAAILLFGFLIAIHEFGHFITAKFCGVRVNEFSIGMGPVLWSRQKGETQYSLRAFPIGGFCAMEGEDESSADSRSLTKQGYWKQFLIFAAGSFMNLLAGFVIILLLYSGASGFYTAEIMDFAPELGGITDEMLKGAPELKEALTAFLDFVDGRPLAAHNAEFDIGFIRAGCRKVGLPFEPTYVDSLILAQNLMPELKKFKLDIVAEALDLPAFNHHRASDDAATVGYMLIPFWEKLHARGIHTLQAVNPEMEKLRPLGSKSNRFPKHIILIAQNKVGLNWGRRRPMRWWSPTPGRLQIGWNPSNCCRRICTRPGWKTRSRN